ncbi:MAG: guanylate kinase [Clostridia bacterium]|jgi:guanylate kinase|nr:guanylate kinase [Clostridia bacterium]
MTSSELLVTFNEEKKRNRNGKLFIISGTTACGKNTLINRVLKDDMGLTLIPSFVTRGMRDGESQGNPYIFMSEEEFMKLVNNNEMFEYENVHKGVYYGTHQKTYEYAVENGYDVIKDIDVNGAEKYKEHFKEKAILIFIKTSTKEVLRQRIVDRHGEDEEQIENRLSRVDYELSKESNYDYVVINDDLEKAVTDLEKIIRNEINA